MVKLIELLAPARTADIGIEAINCGADAVYIGAEAFGARHTAGNSVEDIARLCTHAHRYGARVYVTVNTILYDSELTQVHDLIMRLCEVEVDALIVQDTALLQMDLPLPLHASTQMDIRSAEKVRQLHDWGFRQAVLARELELKDIAAIHKACPEMKLEAFVHGALCVSYSGRCYASQHCFGRSANRGECAQFCRLSFDLQNAEGRNLVSNKHLLSLKDMNRSRSLEQMLDAGISSLKIEGRLKDMAYVKNTTAFYSRLLNNIIRRRPQDYRRSSVGQCHVEFEPNLDKTFNRGFTEYFLHGRTEDVASIDTPKVIGEPVGLVKEIRNNYILVGGTSSFHNGDGISYFAPDGSLQGFRVNRADNNRLFPHKMPADLRPKTPLFRNHDAAFEAAMLRPTPMRTIRLDISMTDIPEGFRLSAASIYGHTATLECQAPHQPALKPQRQRIETELRKTGSTAYEIGNVSLDLDEEYFIPASQLSQWRRQLIEKVGLPVSSHSPSEGEPPLTPPQGEKSLQGKFAEGVVPFTENVANRMARQFYECRGATDIEPAFEIREPKRRTAIMTCRHCIRYSLGMCSKRRNKDVGNREMKSEGPLFLALPNGRRFELEFDCKKCEMRVMK
ncbi:MAG: U32 family peptidase [Bacteroidaceae bacterium]|nr:U32 family peptidase [Bacteroidaceae bacterium]